MDLSFLNDVSLASAEIKTRRSGETKIKYPTEGLVVRVYASGAVYPSPELVEKFGLEYGNKPTDKADPVGNGLDVINSNDWAMVKGLPVALLFIAAVARKEGKIDLFGSTSYDEDGAPVKSVLAQGAETFGKNSLIPMIEEVYGKTIDPEVGYLDLRVVTERAPLQSSNGIYNLPKKVSRGEKKGELTYVRRENIDIYAFVPVEEVNGDVDPAETETEEVGGPMVEHQSL